MGIGLNAVILFFIQVPVVSTSVSVGHAINKLQWDHKDGRRAVMGGSDGRLYVYDIGDMAIPRETEWIDMQKTTAGFVGSGHANGVQLEDERNLLSRSTSSRPL